mmetsp:Transcript_12829/g.19236  ORF Transcript_12829/g.19236 Transcript_12829/m.19236 type:complete len:301 (+) Transcript_12829:36-938(+)
MARNQEKSQLMLNKWITMKQELSSGRVATERRPYLASECSKLSDAERWRMQIIREISRKVNEIQNHGLGEHKLRDLNDQINKLLREKGHWQHRIRQLGGPDYNSLEPKTLDADGRTVPGTSGYKYFGAARDLPGVKELLSADSSQAAKKRLKTRAELNKFITPDYYGFRDESIVFNLLQREAQIEQDLKATAIQDERAAQLKRREARRLANNLAPENSSDDDDPDHEPHFLDQIDHAIASNASSSAAAVAAASETPQNNVRADHFDIRNDQRQEEQQNQSSVDEEARLSTRKRNLLALLS